MRDRGAPTKQKPKPKERTLPLMKPVLPSTDITPRGTKVSREAKGASVLMRGTFEDYLKKHDNKLGPGQKKAIEILKRDRTELLKPKNAHLLSALQRTQPGEELHNAIMKDPHAADQLQLLRAGVSLSPGSRLQLRHQGLSNEEIDHVAAGKLTGDQIVARTTERRKAVGEQQARELAKKQGVKPSTLGFNVGTGETFQKVAPGDWFGRLAGGAMDSVIGMPAFGYYMATTDPKKSIPKIGKTIGSSFAETATHPIRQLTQDPFEFFSNVGAVAGAGVGTGGRLSSLGRAVAERAPGESAVGAAAHGFTHPQVRTLIDLYTSKSPGAQHRIALEDESIAQQIVDSMDTTVAKVAGLKNRGRAAKQDMMNSFRQTYARDVGQHKDIMEGRGGIGFVGPLAGHSFAAGGQLLREVTDGVRLGTIYLRPAYLPNNWAGNLFMNMAHQGVFAPLNLARAFVLHRSLSDAQLRGLRAATGMTAAQAVMGRGRGYVRAVTDPIAHTMGRAADQPFRDAAMLHELRRVGYGTNEKVAQLFHDIENGHQDAVGVAASAGRKALEEIVKFNRLSDVEQSVFRNMFFVYNWVKGATRYATRFPLAHPIQTAIYSQGARGPGADLVNRRIGGLPPYMAGALPVGHGRLSNPFALNPLGTAVDVGRAVQGTASELGFGPKFDPHTMNDIFSLSNPLLNSFIQAREGTGSRSFTENVLRNIAPYSLYQGLAHPGQASNLFPAKSRWDTIGHYVLGSLYPRKYDPQALQASLERMNVNHPEALIDGLKKRFFQKTGQHIPKEVESAYRKDLIELKAQKDFKSDYAHSHRASSYRKLPPINQARAALDYISKHNILPEQQVNELSTQLDQITNDAEAKTIASAIWSMTGVGHGKAAWDALMGTVKAQELTKAK